MRHHRGCFSRKHCWSQVWVVEIEEVLPQQHLYYHQQCQGEACNLLVVPWNKVDMVLHPANAHPLRGHLGAWNTLEKVHDCFHMPGMVAEVRHFCEGWPQRQARPHTPQHWLPWYPYQSLASPLNGWVGPSPKSAWGHEYILVILDYTTCYPEAIPLRKVASLNIAKEVVLLFSCVGILKDIFTDQCTLFTSWLIQDICRLLQV